ncbi:MAG: biotin/lipoyl-binding protein [Megasphaera sp.]|jgi:acetyl-CoA carboxylase biotin carboxyl carrier protein|uniref:acetyl-CoA carboxylase biotin carboxyl carrier protein n=1 Tax=Megasphaera sueciensis TaxID=349094 RepID=UPI003D087DAB|nr:biotin/lipoyl-binding protein [Megasphaera sp.]MCI1822863.1 biotin/lipoyl-binding protein [Megasphaera sp.]
MKEVEALIQMFENSSLTELKIKDKDFSIELIRTAAETVATEHADTPAVLPAAASSDVEKTITAPMVGTFYTAANPNAEPFVRVGDAVTIDTTVCVLEAMKVFTEVPADMSGTITKILVSDGDFVEYGQPLFKIKIN